MKFGVMIVPEDRWQAARDKWRYVDQMGFDHAWTYDHLNWRTFQAKEWFTSVPTLTAAALETSRITLGVLVANPNLRHPVHLAKDITSLEDISAGRIILGLGAGGEGVDASMTRRGPWVRRERSERFAEYVELTDLLLTQPVTSFDGRCYFADEVHMYPQCRQRPRVPFAIAAAGPRGMKLAARHGQYWVTTGEPNLFLSKPYEEAIPLIRRQVQALETSCAAVGRDPATLSRMLVAGPSVGDVLASKEAFFDAAGRFGEVGITDLVVQWPRADEPYPGDVKVLEQVAQELVR